MSTPVEYYLEPFAYDLPEIQPLKSDIDKEKLDSKTKEKTGFQIICIVTASLSAFTSGFLYSWPSPFLLKITQDKEHYNITQDEASYFTVVHPVGMLVLPIFLVPLANTIGRKCTLLYSTIPYAISLLIKAVATNLWWLYFARFLAGAGDAVVFAALPIYIAEVATPQVRGIWGNSFIIGVFLGQCSINIVGSYCNVQVTSYVGFLLLGIFILIFSFMPRSPYFLVMKGFDEEARKSLKRLRCKEDIEDEFLNIKISVEQQMKESGSWKDLVTIKANRRALLAGMFLRASQLLTGVYVFASYTQFIFDKAGGNISAQTSAILYTALTVCMYACAAHVSNLMGRRKSYMISIFLAGIVVLLVAVFFYIDEEHKEINLESFKWFPLAGMLAFVVVSSFGIGIVPTLMLGELFAASIKSKGVSLLTCTFAGSIIITNNIFYYLNSYTGLYGPFFLFGCCNILFTFLAYFIVPETKGKTLDEIQDMLKNM